MRHLEIALVVVVSAWLIALNHRRVARGSSVVLGAAAFSLLALSGLLGHLRWQMAPAYLLCGVLALLLLRRAYSRAMVRLIGVVAGFVLLATSVVLSAGLPILTLPSPSGPSVVGVTSLSLVDESRDDALFGAAGKKREVYVQIWYPGVSTGSASTPHVRTLWEELHRGELDRLTFFTRYLRAIRTHSHTDIPLAPASAPYPVIVFSHAMVSFAEQSTLLMEHLASHGYVVVAVGHPYTSMRVVSSSGRPIYPNLDKVNGASAAFRTVNADIATRLERAVSEEERTELQLERYAKAGDLNAIASIWVGDLHRVLDAITAPHGMPPALQPFSGRLDVNRIGLLGMSFGGGAVTELCKTDARCHAALNIDGDTFGYRQAQPLEIPYLALIREDQTRLRYQLSASFGVLVRQRIE